MRKYLWIVLATCSLTLTSCEEFLDLLDVVFDNPASDYTPTYYEDVAAPDSVYVAEVNQPNPKEYLPEPPVKDDVAFLDDQIQWEWGKAQRGTTRGTTAMAHMGRTPR